MSSSAESLQLKANSHVNRPKVTTERIIVGAMGGFLVLGAATGLVVSVRHNSDLDEKLVHDRNALAVSAAQYATEKQKLDAYFGTLSDECVAVIKPFLTPESGSVVTNQAAARLIDGSQQCEQQGLEIVDEARTFNANVITASELVASNEHDLHFDQNDRYALAAGLGLGALAGLMGPGYLVTVAARMG